MDDKVSKMTNKVIAAIRPVTAVMTFARRPLSAGGPEGIMNYYKDEVIPNWHAPTIKGFSTALGQDLGFGIVNTLVGEAVNYVGGVAGVDVVSKIGRAIKAGGEGQAIGGLADMVIHAHEFNYGGPAAGEFSRRDSNFAARNRSVNRGGTRGKGKAQISSAPGASTHKGEPSRRFR